MPEPELDIVTGAFGFSGRYITQRLLARGRSVRTLTGHPQRANPFGDAVSVAPLDFRDVAALAESMRGASVLYNTYWVRFSHGSSTFDAAIENTRVLLDAAKRAGVRRIVHVSITNPSVESPLPYFRGKALLERDIVASGLPYTILRPAVIFGNEDVLINNIAWILRRSPLFAVPGSGEYKLQPIFVEDLADLAVTAGTSGVNEVIDAIGPETFTFNELLSAIRRAVHSRARVVHLPPALALQLSRVIGFGLRDVVLTSDEVRGLAADLLVTDSPPAGQTRLTDWLASHAASVGRQYASELKRHYR